MESLFLATILFSTLCPQLARAQTPPLTPGVYHLRQVQTMGFPGMVPVAKKPLSGCDIVATMTTTNSTGGILMAELQNSYAGVCGQGGLSADMRAYHFHVAADKPFCGMTYESVETNAGSVAVGGSGIPSAFINDYRNAPAACTAPAEGPAIAPVLTLQETMAGGIVNWQGY